jgi:hypothetical protein
MLLYKNMALVFIKYSNLNSRSTNIVFISCFDSVLG